jgi:hypothetical protein
MPNRRKIINSPSMLYANLNGGPVYSNINIPANADNERNVGLPVMAKINMHDDIATRLKNKAKINTLDGLRMPSCITLEPPKNGLGLLFILSAPLV